MHLESYVISMWGHAQIDNNAATIPWQPITTRKGQRSAINRRTGDLFPSVAWTFVIALPLRPLGLGGKELRAVRGKKGPAEDSLWQRLTCSHRYAPTTGERSRFGEAFSRWLRETCHRIVPLVYNGNTFCCFSCKKHNPTGMVTFVSVNNSIVSSIIGSLGGYRKTNPVELCGATVNSSATECSIIATDQ